MPRESPIKEDLNVPHVGIPVQAWRFLVLSKRKTGLRANRINNKKKRVHHSCHVWILFSIYVLRFYDVVR